MVQERLSTKLHAYGFSPLTGHGPLYLQLADALRGLIASHQLATGNALPAERELAEDLSVSRITVRNAYRELTNTGELEVRRGSGTFVAKSVPLIEQSLWRLSSFSHDMHAFGLQAETRVINRSEGRPKPDEIFLFNVSPHETMLRLDRLRIAEGMPVALEQATVPLALLGETFKDDGSLYEALERGGNKPVRATQRLTAVPLAAKMAALLDTKPDTPCLLIERISRTADGRVIELTRSHYRGDAFDFIAELTIGN